MGADEFDVIRRLFAPLATTPGARGLLDDAALLETTGRLVATTDAIVEGVHFLPDDPIETVAKKAIRVNLSDLTAKGARCVGVLVTLVWPKTRPAADLEGFARGLGEDLAFYEAPLLGGDTTATEGPLVVSVTAFGAPLGARTPARGDATAGEHVWVTGYIGQGFLGLRALQSEPAILGAKAGDRVDAHASEARDWYRTPRPPVRFAEAIARFASASIDVSDGLIGDAAKIAAASGLALRLDGEAIPLTGAGHAYVSREGAKGLAELLSGGDDYQTLFTAAPHHRRAITEAARAADVNVVLIGDVTEGAGVSVRTGSGELDLSALGHSHTLGR